MSGKNKKIILIGYRATVKSTVGKLLAERLNLAFIDMDEVLAARHGEISELVRERGWDYFRAKEKELLVELVGSRNLVISTGGGAILHQDVWPRLKATGLVVWLTADPETIGLRLESDAASEGQRPSLTGDDIKSEAEKVLAEREPLYRSACHLQVDSTRPLVEVAAEIEKALCNGVEDA